MKKKTKSFEKKLLKLMKSHRKIGVEAICQALMGEVVLLSILSHDSPEQGIQKVLELTSEAARHNNVQLVFSGQPPTMH